jgi:uncharacterized protein YdhG (YjbR/CyaY superfamily)
MEPKSESIDAYLDTVAESHRPALIQLREQVRTLCPDATEHLSYGKPLFKYRGHPLVGFAAHKKHSSFFVWSDQAFGALTDVLKGYDIAESTLRFAPGEPPPLEVIAAIVDFRKREIEDRWG